MSARLGVPEAKLTPAQAEMPLIRRLGLASGSAGILAGCVIGMTPLLFMDPDAKAVKEAFASLDTDGSGALEVSEIKKLLVVAGHHDVSDADVIAHLRELGLDGREGGPRVTLEDAQRLVSRIK